MNSQSSYRSTSPMTSSVVPPPNFNRDMFQFRSLPRRSRLPSLPSSNLGPELNLDCECPYNRTNKTKLTLGVLRSNSVTVVRPEASLNDVVEKFEEVLRDQRSRLLNRSSKFSELKSQPNPRMSNTNDFEKDPSQKYSPLNTPSLGLSSFPRNNLRKVDYGYESDGKYRAFALMRQNTVPVDARLQEEKVNDGDTDKLKESCFIVKRNASWCGSRRSDFTNLSPEVSPTNGADHIFGSFVGSTSSATTRSTSADSAVIGSKELSYEAVEGVSINPTQDDRSSVTSVRSIGISTSFAPSFFRKTPSKFLLESLTRSTSTQKVATSDFMCQAVPDRHSRGTETNCTLTPKILSRHVGVSVRPDPGYNESTQTHNIVSYDEAVQVAEKCIICGVKQTETIAIGDSNVKTNDIAIGPDDDMFERFRRERQVEREIESIYEAKPAVVSDADLLEPLSSLASESPSTMSKIPRLHPQPCDQAGSRIVIEETCNEILVYRRPESLVDPIPGKHRALLPQMIAEESQHLISACKIEDDEGEEEMSESSDEESVVVREVLMRQPTKRTEPSKEMKEALKIVNDQLQKSKIDDQDAKTSDSRQIIEGEWFKVSSSKSSDPFVIEDYLDYFETLSSHLLNHIVNMTDCNGNTAMHYAISYSNFDAASVLLDSKVCDVNKLNKAGYSSLMLVSLSKIMNETQKAVVKRLFQLGDVNLKAKQNGQTALMLAASHGQAITVKLLLECGAAVNLQDSDGSTALMCASEHNHVDVVKLLLSNPETDPNLTDSEGSTALSIAMAAGHKDIGLVIYAANNMLSRGSNAYSSLRRPSQAIATSLRRTGSFTSRSNGQKTNFHLSPASVSKKSGNR